MAQRLANRFGGYMEKRAPVASVGFVDGVQSNVMTAYDADGGHLFHLAYRPHCIGTDPNMYDEHGLFLC